MLSRIQGNFSQFEAFDAFAGFKINVQVGRVSKVWSSRFISQIFNKLDIFDGFIVLSVSDPAI